MPRGSKTCKHCGNVTGPRAFFCPKEGCGQPFVMKGKVADEGKRQELEQKKAGVFGKPDANEEIEWLNVDDYFVETDPTPREFEIGGKETVCYMSLDGKFRLRKTEEFMGIPLEMLHNRWYTLLYKNHERDSGVIWQLVKRFKSLNSVLHYIRAVNQGSREVTLYKPGDDIRKNRKFQRLAKRNKKIKTRGK